MKICFKNNIALCRLPSHSSHKLQPCDVGPFGPLKAAYHEQVEKLYRGGANTVGKQHSTLLYSRARSIAFTPRNIRSGWSKTGLYPVVIKFNLNFLIYLFKINQDIFFLIKYFIKLLLYLSINLFNWVTWFLQKQVISLASNRIKWK